jgi:ethanolamine ammonia-lyase small subunit
VERHAPPLLEHLVPKFQALGWKLAPILIAPFARVALEDEIGALLNANIALILLGERPGLGSPDSLGGYLVYAPRYGNTDAQRNCVSNIRPEGLGYRAAETLAYLLTQARLRGLSGILLKDDRKLSEIAVTATVLPAKG